MPVSVFYEVATLVRAVDARAPETDTLTIDFFDTLVVRRLADPDQIKIPVARFLAARARLAGLNYDWQTCLRLRAAIEQSHRQRNGALYPDHEACYPEFMEEVLRRIFGEQFNSRLLEEVTDWELRLEQAVIVPRAALLDLIRRWHAQGKRIWVMTDIYLPTTHIRRLAAAAGVLAYLEGIVSSADECQAKASGAGFRRLQAKLQLDPARWMHVGDNPVSDGLQPARLGIRALVLRDASEQHRKTIYRRYAAAAAARPFWKGRLMQQWLLPLEDENIRRDPRAAFGYDLFGPLTGGFIQHIAERAQALGLRRLYFFSREGQMLMRAWQRAVPWFFPHGGAPQARYLYVSRVALASATCAHRGLTRSDAPLALLPATNRDIRDIFRVFGLSLRDLQDFLARHALAVDAPLNPLYAGWREQNWRRFEALLQDASFQAAVQQQTQAQGRLVERYLEQEGFFELPTVGVVDIGWLGTIQRFLAEAIAHRTDKPHIHGFLLGSTSGAALPSIAWNQVEGFLYDRSRSSSTGRAITYALDIFEEALRAPHAGVMGYAEQGGRIEPVLQAETDPERLGEIEQNAHYAPLQEAIPPAVERYAAAVTCLGLTAADNRPWLNHLVTMRLAFPRRAEMQSLQVKHHADQYSAARQPPLRARLELLRLWDLPPALLPIPGLRLAFYAWTLVGLPYVQRAGNLMRGLKNQARRILLGPPQAAGGVPD